MNKSGSGIVAILTLLGLAYVIKQSREPVAAEPVDNEAETEEETEEETEQSDESVEEEEPIDDTVILPTQENYLSGTVTDNNGNPLAGVTVSLDDASVITNANGYYKFSDISVGSHSIKFTKSGYILTGY